MKLLKSLFGSKKFVTAIGSAIAVVILKMGGPESVQELIPYLLGIAGTYILGQSLADHGKEKARVERKANKNGD